MATVTLILFMLCIATKMLVYYRAPISDYTEDEIANLLDCQISRLKISSKIQVSRCNLLDTVSLVWKRVLMNFHYRYSCGIFTHPFCGD